MSTVIDEYGPDEVATRAAMEELPKGYVILWDRDSFGDFCGELRGPTGLNLCSLVGERERVLRVLSEAAHESAAEAARA